MAAVELKIKKVMVVCPRVNKSFPSLLTTGNFNWVTERGSFGLKLGLKPEKKVVGKTPPRTVYRLKQLLPKGQLISELSLGVFKSPKKQPNFRQTTSAL